MDIKILSEFLTGKPAVSQTGDLLAQLKTAGTVEAEVIKVLQGKLLLSSRLGEILTTNTLNYKPGDQINLRLGGDAQNPVLKASPRIPGPVILDSTSNPRLSRALPADQPVLALVSGITAQRIEIRLAGQILTLPRQPGIAQDQLLSLQRNDARRSIEITPLDRKLIYKGLLKQLVPEQPKSNSVSLVRLLNLVNKAVDAAQSNSVPAADSSRQSSPIAIANKLRLQVSQPVATPARKLPVALTDKSPLPAKTDTQAQLLLARAAGISSRETTNRNEVTPGTSDRLLGKLMRQVSRTDSGPAAPAKPAQPVATRSGTVAQASSVNAPNPAPGPPLAGTGNIGNGATGSKPPASANAAQPAPVPDPAKQPQSTLPAGQIYPAQGNAPRELNPNQPPPQPSATPTLLQILLQMVPKMPAIDANRIKQWFEFSSLIRSADVKPGSAAPADSFKTLKQLLGKDTFSRELELTLQPGTKSSATDEAAPAKTIAREILLAQVRDGIKLVEQALSQNLLQRASLGMQQETQQPPSLSLALPFLDQHEVKPLHVEAEQRDQPQEDKEQSWDIRLSFELAGLGPVACHLFLQGVTVAASFYCENSRTRVQVEQALPELKQQL